MPNVGVHSPCKDGGAGTNRKGCPVRFSPSMGNDVLLSALAPGDSWLSEHIPLAAIHTPLSSTHAQMSRRYTPLSLYRSVSLLVLSCPLPYSSTSCDSTFNNSLPHSLPVLICLSLCYPDWEEPRFNSALYISLFCQIAKLAIVFNHSHSAKSHEVIKNF